MRFHWLIWSSLSRYNTSFYMYKLNKCHTPLSTNSRSWQFLKLHALVDTVLLKDIIYFDTINHTSTYNIIPSLIGSSLSLSLSLSLFKHHYCNQVSQNPIHRCSNGSYQQYFLIVPLFSYISDVYWLSRELPQQVLYL